MDPKHKTFFAVFFFVLLMLIGSAKSDLAQDRAECANELVGLATCLPYVGGDSKAPTLDCCTGLKQVLDKSKKCLCILIKDRDDPNLGLKINATLAATLPSTCHAPVNISQCITLLHLAPNSTEAKEFEGYEKLAEGMGKTSSTGANSTTSSTASSAPVTSDGGKGKKRWMEMEKMMIIFAVPLWIFSSNLMFDVWW